MPSAVNSCRSLPSRRRPFQVPLFHPPLGKGRAHAGRRLREASLYLLDAHGLIFQMFHGIGPMSAPDGRPTNAVFGVTRALADEPVRPWCRLPHRGGSTTGSPTFRDKLFDPSYKAHLRAAAAGPADAGAADSPDHGRDAHPIPDGPRLRGGRHHGDARRRRRQPAGSKDLHLCRHSDQGLPPQLLSPKVKIMNLRKGEIIDADVLMKDWGVTPVQVVDYQAMVGDSVDNVPGVPGVGPKTAAKWLPEFGSLDAIIANADEVGGDKKSKVKDALKESIANGKLEQSRKTLVTGSTTRVPGLERRLPGTGWRRRDWDGQRLLELCQEFGFRGFAEKVRNTLRAGSGEEERSWKQHARGHAASSARCTRVRRRPILQTRRRRRTPASTSSPASTRA